MPSKQAEAITAAITEVLNDSLENVSQSLVSKGEMQRVRALFGPNFNECLIFLVVPHCRVKCNLCSNISCFCFCLFLKTEMLQEANLSKFKAEVQSSQVFLAEEVGFDVCDIGACG